MPEGDTIHHAANRIRPVLEGRVPDEIVTPQRRHAADRWPAAPGRAGASSACEARGKHLLIALRGRPRAALAPAHERRVGGPRRAASAGGARRGGRGW